MRHLRIGLVGCGVVGRGVAKALLSKQPPWDDEGLRLELVAVADRSWSKGPKRFVPKRLRSKDPLALAKDPRIEILVVAIGGVREAEAVIRAALDRGKAVVTPNKAVLAHEGAGLFRLARARNRELAFEAAVAGGIPILLALRAGYAANRIESVTAILNGTTNYILTRMEETGAALATALKEAQAKGFAEADPTLDLCGADAAHKLSLLTGLLFRRRLDPRRIPTQGIERILPTDLAFAKRWGYGIKGIARVRRRGSLLEVEVTPALLPERSALRHIREERNAIHLEGDLVGPALLAGLGAGEGPTASAVLADLIEVARTFPLPPPGGYAVRMAGAPGADLLGPERSTGRYYLRLLADDRPGVLARVTRILGRSRISIAAVHQTDGTGGGRGRVPVAILTHETTAARIAKALFAIDRTAGVAAGSVAFPVVEA